MLQDNCEVVICAQMQEMDLKAGCAPLLVSGTFSLLLTLPRAQHKDAAANDVADGGMMHMGLLLVCVVFDDVEPDQNS